MPLDENKPMSMRPGRGGHLGPSFVLAESFATHRPDLHGVVGISFFMADGATHRIALTSNEFRALRALLRRTAQAQPFQRGPCGRQSPSESGSPSDAGSPNAGQVP